MPERAVWTTNRIERFWAYRSTRKQRQDEYFSYQVGSGVVEFLAWTGRLHGPVLDYGSGPGYLLERFLDRGIQSAGADLSVEAVRAVEQRLGSHPEWLKCVPVGGDGSTDFDDAMFSVVSCVETLEHLTDDLIADVLREIRRVLAPDGIALFTTPNREDLEANLVYCPFCEIEYHPVQHLRSFDRESMERTLGSNGFRTIFIGGLNFDMFQRPFPPSWKDLSPREIVASVRRLRARVADRVFPRPFLDQREFRLLLGQGDHHLAAVAVPA